MGQKIASIHECERHVKWWQENLNWEEKKINNNNNKNHHYLFLLYAKH